MSFLLEMVEGFFVVSKRPWIFIWLVVWNILDFSIYWEKSSQLTFIFFKMVQTTNQLCFFQSGKSGENWRPQFYEGHICQLG